MNYRLSSNKRLGRLLDRPKNLGGTIDLHSSVRPYVRPNIFRLLNCYKNMYALYRFSIENSSKLAILHLFWRFHTFFHTFFIFFGPTQEFGRDYRFALVRTSVRPSVRPNRFRSNGPIVFSDFWYQGSFL